MTDRMESSAQYCFCGKEAVQRCSGCQAVYYCCREHQRSNWKEHRSNCRAYRIEETLNVGRHLIASRDLKAGNNNLFKFFLPFIAVVGEMSL